MLTYRSNSSLPTMISCRSFLPSQYYPAILSPVVISCRSSQPVRVSSAMVIISVDCEEEDISVAIGCSKV